MALDRTFSSPTCALRDRARPDRRLVSLTTGFPEWHKVAVANVRAGDAFAVASAGHFGAVLVWGVDVLRAGMDGGLCEESDDRRRRDQRQSAPNDRSSTRDCML